MAFSSCIVEKRPLKGRFNILAGFSFILIDREN